MCAPLAAGGDAAFTYCKLIRNMGVPGLWHIRNEWMNKRERKDELMQVQDRPNVRTVAATGAQVIDTIRNLVLEGNVRRISIKQDGRTIAEFPLTLGVVGAALAPALAAIGAMVALVADCTIEVERADQATRDSGEPMAAP